MFAKAKTKNMTQKGQKMKMKLYYIKVTTLVEDE